MRLAGGRLRAHCRRWQRQGWVLFGRRTVWSASDVAWQPTAWPGAILWPSRLVVADAHRHGHRRSLRDEGTGDGQCAHLPPAISSSRHTSERISHESRLSSHLHYLYSISIMAFVDPPPSLDTTRILSGNSLPRGARRIGGTGDRNRRSLQSRITRLQSKCACDETPEMEQLPNMAARSRHPASLSLNQIHQNPYLQQRGVRPTGRLLAIEGQ